jgi:hypothetical protein
MLPQVDFDQASSVSEFVRAKFRALYAGADDAWLQQLFRDMDDTFNGRSGDYAAVDLKYHNFQHTLMATVCMAQILEGQHMAPSGIGALMTPRDFELAIAAVLLHDTGYLKLKRDAAGTGAKYTYCHIVRSCAFAASYLPLVGAGASDVDSVVAAINCTGPNSDINWLRFRDPVSRLVGCALATSDYLGQLADPDYVGKLGHLYAEFRESDDFVHVAPEQRVFKSAEDLLRRTPGFWINFVRPKLDRDFQGVYRFLERPIGSGKNGYLEAVDANFAEISRRIAAPESTGG